MAAPTAATTTKRRRWPTCTCKPRTIRHDHGQGPAPGPCHQRPVPIQSFAGRWSSFTRFFTRTGIRRLQNPPPGRSAHQRAASRTAGPFRPRSRAIPSARRNASGSIHSPHLRAFVARRRQLHLAVVLSFEQVRPRASCDLLVLTAFVTWVSQGGPWNEPVLTLAVLFFHASWTHPLLDGCDRASQP